MKPVNRGQGKLKRTSLTAVVAKMIYKDKFSGAGLQDHKSRVPTMRV